uniref:Uncharacterized protein n=1 Tax=Hordeum vulgare subsp. vulgare TaxID=112509 RepID=A0A8I6WS47_HORVV
MNKIKTGKELFRKGTGKELVEEVRKIEKNINAGGTISSLLELSVAGISLDTCEVPIPSHSLQKDNIHEEEERPQSEDVLEAKAQDDPKLEFPNDQVEEPSSLTLEEVKEAVVLEDEELEIHLPIVIQECDVTGLSNPLDGMRPYDFFSSTLHYKIQSLKVDLKNHLLGDDDTHPVSGIAHISIDDTCSPHARSMLNDKYYHHASIELADSYYPKHVIYCYGYIIGYSIDDLEGISLPLAFSLLLSALSGFCLCTIYYMRTSFEVTFLGTLVDSKHGEEEKQGALMKKSEARAGMR